MLTSYKLKYLSVSYSDETYRDNYDLIKTTRVWYMPWRKIITKTRVYKIGKYDDFHLVDLILYYVDNDLPCELATRLYTPLF